jgi:hypothetical protein
VFVGHQGPAGGLLGVGGCSDPSVVDGGLVVDGSIVVVVVGEVYPLLVSVVVDPVQVVMVCDVDKVEEVVVGGRVVGVSVCCGFPTLPQADANPAVTTTSTMMSERTAGTFAGKATRSPFDIATSALSTHADTRTGDQRVHEYCATRICGPPLSDLQRARPDPSGNT